MNKDDINKTTIIIGIGTLTITIVIIAVISIFTPKSHAQVEKNKADHVATYLFSDLNAHDKLAVAKSAQS